MTALSSGSPYTRRFDDPDHYQTSICGGGSFLTLLGRGNFSADLSRIEVGSLTLQNGLETLPRLAATAIPRDKVGILLWFDNNRLPVVRGVQIQPGELMCLGPGMESFHRTFGPNEFAALTLDATEFAGAVHDFTGCDLVVAAGEVVRPPEHVFDRVRSTIRSAIRVSKSQPKMFLSPQAVNGLEEALLRSMIACLHEDVYQDRVPPVRRATLARRFAEVVEANLDRALLSRELSQMVGVSERTLRKLCHEQMGISPSRFLALRRLHLARQTLLQADRHSATVTEIAMGLGIWELGRFAVAYKSLFGESPSATLHRQRAAPPQV